MNMLFHGETDASKVGSLNGRHIYFAVIVATALGMLCISYYRLLQSPVQRDYYSHLIFIPLISAYFGYQVRSDVVRSRFLSASWGLVLAFGGIAISIAGWLGAGNLALLDSAAMINFGAAAFVVGGFLSCYGREAFKHAMFPLLFLLFAVPLPSAVMHQVIQFLQTATSAVSEPLFHLTGVPFVREGNHFYLESVAVEVAEECSGIRSSLSLLILSVIAGKMVLAGGWRRVVLALSVIPITILKNGVRVVTLSLLGAYVDPRILTHSTIHSNSGMIIFILPLTLLGLVLWLLKRGEKKADKTASLEDNNNA